MPVHNRMISVLMILLLSSIFCCAHKKNNGRTRENKWLPKKCTNNISLHRIVHGSYAEPGRFPWLALLGDKANGTNKFNSWHCAGSLITHRHILTAAHCVEPFKDRSKSNSYFVIAIVRLGESDYKSNKKEGAKPVDYEPEKIIIHEGRYYDDVNHDIALIKLKKRVRFTKHINPICLPPGRLGRPSLVGEWALVAGWGQTVFNGRASSKLKYLPVKIVRTRECARKLRRWIDNLQIGKNQLCAGGSEVPGSPCKGDSGGPLMYSPPGARTPYLVGIVSYGLFCYDSAVYTRVTQYMDWILDHLDV